MDNYKKRAADSGNLMWRASLRLIFGLLLCVQLVGCGGGGGAASSGSDAGAGNSSSSSSSSLQQTSIVLTPLSAVAKSDTGDLPFSAPTQSFHVVINNPPADPWYYQILMQNSAVKRVTAKQIFVSGGDFTVEYWTPAVLGAGTYTDTIQFRLCSDAQCAQPIVGASASVSVTYIVTGSPLPLTNFYISPAGNVEITAKSTDTQPVPLKVGLMVFNIPPKGLQVRIAEQAPAGSPKLIADLAFAVTGDTSADISLQLKAPSSLSAGTYTETLQVYLCFDSACTQMASGSPASISLRYVIYASEGRDFRKIDLELNAQAVAYDAVGQKLYVLHGSQTGEEIAVVDPATGALGTKAAVPDESSSVVISDDGQFAYVRSTYGSAVYRYRLPALTLDETIHLPGSQQATQIVIAPGAPHTIAVAQSYSALPTMTAIYDDLVKRQDEALAGGFVWGKDSTELFSQEIYNQNSPPAYDPRLKTWTISASGFTLAATEQLIDGALGLPIIYRQDRKLYGSSGYVYDLNSHSFLQRLPLDGVVGYDFALDRAYAFRTRTLEAASISTRAPLFTAPLPDDVSPRNVDLPPVRFGTNGLALVTYNGHLILLTGTFVAP